MIAMRNELTLRLRLGLMASACGVLLAFAGVAQAQQAADDDDEDTFEQRIIKNILGGIGADVGRNKGIDYRERSPLVIPPSLNLPPPEQSAGVRNAAWPKEPERKKATKQVRTYARSTMDDPGSHARMTPDELRRAPPGPKGAGSGSVAESDPMQGRALRPGELGQTQSIFSWSSLTGNYKNETAKFEGEPGRGALTQPPPGYQTPSSAYPYGVGNESSGPGWKIPTILDRPVGQEQ
jgi:hypothetical protein